MGDKKYYVGLDIGTSSVGYAVTDEEYNLLKHKGEPMWGSHIFEEGQTAETRRSFRTARRRNDRRKQRINLLSEIFASEIAKVDERFFIRRRESALFREDVKEGDKYIVFNEDGFTDKDYYEKYPTIHHLICELIKNKEPHDVRLVYMACAYLLAHRGHFLSEVNKDDISKVTDFEVIYDNFMDIMRSEYDIEPWTCDINEFRRILKLQQPVREKEKLFHELLNNGKKFKMEDDADIDLEGILKLLSGGTFDLAKMFPKSALEEKTSISFKTTKEEDFTEILGKLDDEAQVLIAIRNIYDWAVLDDVLKGNEYISVGKVNVYEQHKQDLKYLKSFIRKYKSEKYDEIFRDSLATNYVAYSYNIKNTPNPESVKKADKYTFCDYIKKIVKDIDVNENDKVDYEDMLLRLETYQFCPKQIDGDNRVIPYQLYYHELKKILENALEYLSFLNEADEDGYINKDKILSIMEFRVPYFVGPLRKDNSQFAWIERKADGKIYPWNFEEKVDLDKSEQEFIKRMINTCTYLPGEKVLPKSSLLYEKFNVLNEINNIKINNESIPVEHKQGIFELFKSNRKVSVKRIKDYLVSNNLLHDEDVFSGLDTTLKSSLKTYHDFKRLLEHKVLTEYQIEEIVERITYSEDKKRVARWLRATYTELPEEDIQYISKLKYKDFGRLSARFLNGISGCDKSDGELSTIIDKLWETNDNLMQMLSEKYTFTEEIEEIKKNYYNDNPTTLETLLEERYINNSVKRSIYRTLDILKDVRKACGGAPDRIFVEMARGGGEKGKRTLSRRSQIEELYKAIDVQEVRELSKELEGKSDNELQSEVLFLYFMQLGKCAYTGKTLDIEKLKTNLYNVDHIWPQSYVKDDSIDNKVLVISEENAAKGDIYPIKAEIREKMGSYWKMLRHNHLISEEKYKRLTRNTHFSAQEKQGFINRQLVSTRQSTKAVAEILKMVFPDTEIIYSKASLASDFRHEVLKRYKTRSINDLHHAKDAYLNIVVGNVYYCRFTKRFYIDQQYSMKMTTIFNQQIKDGNQIVWNGKESIDKVRKTIDKNNIHYTKFAFMRKGGLFDQMPLKASDGLIPRKNGLDTEKYGGYNKSTATAFILVKYKDKNKDEVSLMPVDLMAADKVFSDEQYAIEYSKVTLAKLYGREISEITDISLPLGLRTIKINTMFMFDGFRACLSGKSEKSVLLSSMMPLTLGYKWEEYIKRLESWTNKKEKNKQLVLDEIFDGISKEKNLQLYEVLSSKVIYGIYAIPFSGQSDTLKRGKEIFEELYIEKQIEALLNLVLLLKSGRAGSCDLTAINGKGRIGIYRVNTKISNWKKSFRDVRIVDVSPSGIYETKSENLLELL